jgi:hypothetical protein
MISFKKKISKAIKIILEYQIASIKSWKSYFYRLGTISEIINI